MTSVRCLSAAGMTCSLCALFACSSEDTTYPLDATVFDTTVVDSQKPRSDTNYPRHDASVDASIDVIGDMVGEECVPLLGSWPCTPIIYNPDGPGYDAGAINTESGLARVQVSSDIVVAGSVAVSYDAGANEGGLSVKEFPALVNAQIASGVVPLDDQGLYLVLADPKLLDPSACNFYCGWHEHFRYDGGTSDTLFGVIVDTGMCPIDCSEFSPSSATPNGSLSADSMVSVIAHEIAEVATDPMCGSGWTDIYNSEIGDLAAWRFSPAYMLPSGAPYNVKVGGRYFLIQQIWSISNQTTLGSPDFDVDAAVPLSPEAGLTEWPPGVGPILYFGGPVVARQLRVYWLWLGEWKMRQTVEPIITDFVNGLGSSGWWKVPSAYFEEPALLDGGIEADAVADAKGDE